VAFARRVGAVIAVLSVLTSPAWAAAACQVGRRLWSDLGADYAACLRLEGFSGVNLNDRPAQPDERLLQDACAGWVHAFVDALKARADPASGKPAGALDPPARATKKPIPDAVPRRFSSKKAQLQARFNFGSNRFSL
jgi:hypothetical protein